MRYTDITHEYSDWSIPQLLRMIYNIVIQISYIYTFPLDSQRSNEVLILIGVQSSEGVTSRIACYYKGHRRIGENQADINVFYSRRLTLYSCQRSTIAISSRAPVLVTHANYDACEWRMQRLHANDACERLLAYACEWSLAISMMHVYALAQEGAYTVRSFCQRGTHAMSFQGQRNHMPLLPRRSRLLITKFSNPFNKTNQKKWTEFVIFFEKKSTILPEHFLSWHNTQASNFKERCFVVCNILFK